ncbi:MAG TPA: hypothetical protein PK141_17845 [Polyangiaceae bacterium]|nr:hypothetical protein [Polyangiaceae bacterium]
MTTPVGHWHPSLLESVKLAWRPLLAYFLFAVFGFGAFVLTIISYERGDSLEVIGAVLAGLAGLVTGQFIALLRFRTIPVLMAGFFLMWVGVYVGLLGHVDLPKVLLIGTFFFCFALPSGMLSLHHRFELLGAFWPSVGWIGAVMIILNNEGRVSKWEESKMSAWMPIPLLLLGGFLVGLLFFMASKQAMRVSIWESLSGATSRRDQKKATVSALPRKNVLPLLGAALLVFAFTAVLAPYLWRTGKGDRKGHQHAGKPTEEPSEPSDGGEPRPSPRGPKFDEEAIRQAMQRAASSAKSAAQTLWPLLLLALFYRPVKRALLTSHLVTPIFPTPPSERIENLWEYVRIAAEDAGTLPLASDSVEQFVERAVAPPTPEGTPEAPPPQSPAPPVEPHSPLAEAARIYVRTRYGFVVAPGDALGMKRAAVPAAKALRVRMNAWDHVKAWWRPLA